MRIREGTGLDLGRYMGVTTLVLLVSAPGPIFAGGFSLPKMPNLSSALPLPKMPKLPSMPSLPKMPTMPKFQLPQMPGGGGSSGSSKTHRRPRQNEVLERYESDASQAESPDYLQTQAALRRRNPLKSEVAHDAEEDDLYVPLASGEHTSRVRDLGRAIDALNSGVVDGVAGGLSPEEEGPSSDSPDLRSLSAYIPPGLKDARGQDVRGILEQWQSSLSEGASSLPPEQRRQLAQQAAEFLAILKQSLMEQLETSEAGSGKGTVVYPDSSEVREDTGPTEVTESRTSDLRRRIEELRRKQR